MIHYKGSPMLETKRLFLRKMEMNDADRMFDYIFSDTRVMDHLIKGPHQSISETKARLTEITQQYESDTFCYWGMVLKESGELIGTIDLFNFDDDTENCEVGYDIGYQWWNQGYGTEALQAIVEFAFRMMNIHKISATHGMDNPASGKLMEKVGMKREGIIRHMIRKDGQYKDCGIYGILQEEYVERNAGSYIVNDLS
ncbi:GNAT family N-acetyltransferase [Rossellomorea aquimaris]|uniref:GNAT family N-acetyltransferase n=1 Tax=Rossellomorea aquimaris TaxID=189382 RepID=UPI001CD4C108|nr:GNAT family protein [Rossellomorea aquimaris]MCA1054337.1 GNAT family N-acetyltransferase [Rossellomorea aquimaris]